MPSKNPARLKNAVAARMRDPAFRRLERKASGLVAQGRAVTDAIARQLVAKARAGSAPASYALATWHLFGHTCETMEFAKDLPRAVKLLKFAAKRGVPEAHYDLAVCYERGAGVGKSAEEALRCYMKAALLGDADATREVGRMYFHGIGVGRDREIGRAWIKRAREMNGA